MIIIIGGELKLCCGMVQSGLAKQRGWCLYMPRCITRAQVLSRMRSADVVLCLCEVTARKTDVRERMATPTRKHKYEEVRWYLSCSNLAVRCAVVCFAFHFPFVGIPSLVAITITHMNMACVAAWARPTYQYHVTGMNTVSRSVSQSNDVFP